MKTDVAKTDNELIAEFMGFTYAETPQDRFWNGPDKPFATIYDWQYHTNHLENFQTSWDWLMPVVEKIANLYVDSNHDRYWVKAVNDLRMPILSTTLGFVYKAVVEFIKWYNSQHENKKV